VSINDHEKYPFKRVSTNQPFNIPPVTDSPPRPPQTEATPSAEPNDPQPRQDAGENSKPNNTVRFSVKPAISKCARSAEEIAHEFLTKPFINMSFAEGITLIPEFRKVVYSQTSVRSKDAIREPKPVKSSIKASSSKPTGVTSSIASSSVSGIVR
jgi:hypothetical protein